MRNQRRMLQKDVVDVKQTYNLSLNSLDSRQIMHFVNYIILTINFGGRRGDGKDVNR
jgi:hypothetical protein